VAQLRRHLRRVCALDTPTSRATSSTFRLASTCFSAPIICASLCLLFDIPRFDLPQKLVQRKLLRDSRLADQAATGTPTSACFRIATICSTENRLRLTANLPSWSFDVAGNSLSDWIKNPGAAQIHSIRSSRQGCLTYCKRLIASLSYVFSRNRQAGMDDTPKTQRN